MLKTRLILIAGCVLVIFLLFQLPKSVVENQGEMADQASDTLSSHIEKFAPVPDDVRKEIARFRGLLAAGGRNEKNAIFADSLANLYRAASQFDSAGWYAEEASAFFNDPEHWRKVADNYYQAYAMAVDAGRQADFAVKAQAYYEKVLKVDPGDLDAKTNLAMTYVTSTNPMQGITMLREVLSVNPKHEPALFSMAVLSIQSRQYERAVERLEQLIEVNPDHLQGHLLLGVALMNTGDKEGARHQFEKVKQMDDDPAVQSTADSYLKDLK